MNEYLPGDYLTELDVAAAFQTSKSPVRDALKKLEAEKLVVAVSKRGYEVTTLSPSSILERFVVRRVLEVAAAELAATHRQREGMVAVERLLDELGQDGTSSDERGWLTNNRRFHAAIAEAGGNGFLAQLIDHVHSDLQRALFVDILASGRETMKQDHERLLAAIRSGDMSRAATEAACHVDDARLRILGS